VVFLVRNVFDIERNYMTELEQEIIDRLIGAFLAGKMSAEERTALETWILESAENKNYFQQVKNIWEVACSATELSQIDTGKALKKTMHRISGGWRPVRIVSVLQKVAAVLLLPLLAGGYFLGGYQMLKKQRKQVIYHEVTASSGTRSSLNLADGTIVWLNSGSHIKYPDRFTGNNRLVYLEGEAFFSVKADKTHPFYVETNKLTLKATGTQFNLMAYPGSSDLQVTLVEGAVDVFHSGKDKKQALIGTLHPNEHLRFDTLSSGVSINSGDVYKYFAWKDGKLIFRNESLAEVVKVLNRLFHADITIMDKDIEDYRYRATFREESLSDILYLLKMSSPIKYREIASKAMPDGSFSKRNILIYKK